METDTKITYQITGRDVIKTTTVCGDSKTAIKNINKVFDLSPYAKKGQKLIILDHEELDRPISKVR